MFLFIKLAALFAITNLITHCNAACPGAATVPTESSAISGIAGSTSHVLTNRGYSLTKSKIWKTGHDKDGKTVSGIEFTYSSDCCGLADIVHMYGSTAAHVWSVSITQKVTAIILLYKNTVIRDIGFTLEDGSTIQTCNCDCSLVTTLTLTGNLIGLATKTSTSLNLLIAE